MNLHWKHDPAWVKFDDYVKYIQSLRLETQLLSESLGEYFSTAKKLCEELKEYYSLCELIYNWREEDGLT